MSLESMFKHFGDCKISEVKNRDELAQEYFDRFGESEESLEEEYLENEIVKFAEYAISECTSREVEECLKNCYNCILNMLHNYNKNKLEVQENDKKSN